MDLKLKDKIGSYFGIPLGNTSYPLYFGSMNERGKITARSLLDLITILCETISETEETEQPGELSNYDILNSGRAKKTKKFIS